MQTSHVPYPLVFFLTYPSILLRSYEAVLRSATHLLAFWHRARLSSKLVIARPGKPAPECTSFLSASVRLPEPAMRLSLLPPGQLTSEQRLLYERNRRQIQKGFTSFKTLNEDGALLGPWGVFLHEPTVGQAHYDLIDAVTDLKRLAPAAKQVAILVVGARYKAAYELYAHAATAEKEGMPLKTIATIAGGGRPDNLTSEEICAFDVANALLDGGVLPGATYRAALSLLGQGALNELILWISVYASVAITLNAYDVPSEEDFSLQASS